ncbi:MAG TPA: glycoside hydrolase family 97 protein [Bryobacteraceae bacterium]|nr:glycoside hydrolase family 97 protein [Bryobacteraceae bacterium]
MRPLLIALIPVLAIAQSTVQSPDGAIELSFTTENGQLAYSVSFHGRPLLTRSTLALDIQDQPELGGAMRLVDSKPGSVDETYTMPHGKSNPVRNVCHTLTLNLQETHGPNRKLTIEARAYNDGVAFRYIIPNQPILTELRLAGERTEFQLAKDATTWPLILENFHTSYEDNYNYLPLSAIHREDLVALPLLAELPGVGWVAITEADIDNYAGMYLQHNGHDPRSLFSKLAPSAEDPGIAVSAATPVRSPWRVIMIGAEPGRLIESNIVINLNPPSKIADTSWIKPGKTAWDWWSGSYAEGVDFHPGMNTATMNHYIDFSAANGLEYMLIDAGWAARGSGPNDSGSDLTHTNPNIDMPAILAHAKSKNVGVWLWAHWNDISRQMDEAFPLFEQWGVKGVKIDFMNRDDQWMVNFYHRVVEKAAEHHLMIDFHGAYKPDGLRRTWPNLVTREGVMGAEYNKWSARVTPDHNVTLPFTRMLAGPMDYTPGGFNNATRDQFVPRNRQPMVQGTRAHALALYAVFESALQMVSDYPEIYKGQPEMDYIRAVPTVWDETHVIGGRPGEWISVARRHGREWFVGSLTGWRPTDIDLPLEFLGHGDFIAEIYSDAPDAADNPKHTVREEKRVNASTLLHVKMAPGGGQAIRIRPAQ